MKIPDWIPNAIFYHIYPLGLCGAPYENEPSNPPVNRLAIIKDWIPHIKSLGCNAIYIGPLFESLTHGYDTTDYQQVDRRLGCNSDLKNLIDMFHQNGMHVILDAVFNHVGRQFPAFMDVQKNGQNSPYKDWFAGLDFSQTSPLGDPFIYQTWEGHYSLVKLNLENPEVCKYLLDTVRFWFDTWHIDGLRLDAIDQVSLNFLRQLHQTIEGINPQAWVMGESVHGDYRTWANPEMAHAITNYECYKGFFSSHNDQNLFEIAYSFKRQFGDEGIYRDITLYNFVDNHDVNRLPAMIDKQDYLNTIYLLMYTMPGVPSIYYGSEWGINASKTPTNDRDLRPTLHLQQMQNNPPQAFLTDCIQQLANIRHNHNALKLGNYQELWIQNKQFAFLRQYADETIMVAINIDEQPAYITLQPDCQASKWVDLVSTEHVFHCENGSVSFDIPPNTGRILQAHYETL
ncbi:MAG: alpha-glucosidase C-terminal domain-containing protein [Anaerolineaceae bacterium]|nr:alpha-glucosidase C-terminal domain-containing protein [Anaerolineaceae bacterium]